MYQAAQFVLANAAPNGKQPAPLSIHGSELLGSELAADLPSRWLLDELQSLHATVSGHYKCVAVVHTCRSVEASVAAHAAAVLPMLRPRRLSFPPNCRRFEFSAAYEVAARFLRETVCDVYLEYVRRRRL